MKINRILLIALLVAGAVPAAAGAAEHPRLFFGAGELPAMQARAQASHRAIAEGLKRGTAEFLDTTPSPGGDVRWGSGRNFNMGDVRDVGNALVVFAFDAQLDPAALPLAKNWLMNVAGWGSFDLDGQKDLAHAHTLAGAAMAYDMLFASLSDAERSQVRGALVREAQALMAEANSGLWWANSYTQNHNWINHAAVGLAALATEGEVDAGSTSAWLDFAVSNAKKVAQVIDGMTDGTWHEGYAYLSYGLQWHLPFLEALRRSGRDDLTAFPVLRGLGAARTYAQIPEAPSTYVLSSGDFTSFTEDEGLMGLRFAASRLKDGYAQAAADRWAAAAPRKVYAPEANQLVFEFLFWDPAVPATDLAAAPLDWYGSDQQAVVFRSGWDKGATLFSLKSGSFGGRSVWQKLAKGDASVGALNFSHDHADDNGFYLYANGAWSAPEAQGYYIGHPDSPGPQANGTAFHNALLVDGQGQLGSGVRDHYDDGQGYDWFGKRQGSIPFHGSSQHFAFATGDGSKLYSDSLGVQQWDRHALFLDRKNVILYDVMKSAQPRTWTWLSHFTGNASQDGRWIHGTGENGQALGVAMVAPINYSMSFESQSPAKANNFVSDGNFGSAQVTTGPSNDNTFLAALVPVAEAGWDSRPKVEAIDAAQPHTGLRLAEGNRIAAAVFGGADAKGTSVGGYVLAGLAGVVATQDGAPVRALLVHGTSIAKDGKELLAVSSATEMLEAEGLSSAEVVLSGAELKSARVWAPNATKLRWYDQQLEFKRDGEFAVVALATALAGQAPAGDGVGTQPAPVAAPTASGRGAETVDGALHAGGGCGSAGPGDLIAIFAVLAALVLVGRARRRAPAPVIVVRNIPLRRRDDDDEPKKKVA